MALGFHTSVFLLCCGKQMGHKIKYGANFFLKINFFPYLPTHFWGVMLPETNILFILALPKSINLYGFWFLLMYYWNIAIAKKP